MFTGPILAVHRSQISEGQIVMFGSGPYLGSIDLLTGKNQCEKILSDSVSIHAIKETKTCLVAFGGREIWIRNKHDGTTKLVISSDWILAATVYENRLFLVLMHNNLEIYDISIITDSPVLIRTIACPEKALLYSAEIRVRRDDSMIEIFGGGVLSSVFFWAVSLDSLEIKSFSVNNREHRGSVFKMRLSKNGDSLLTTSDDRTAMLWKRSKINNIFSISEIFPGHLARVWDAVFMDSGSVATACEDGLIRIFNSDGKFETQLNAHAKDVRCLSYFDRVIYSGGEDGCVREWRLNSEEISSDSKSWTLPNLHTSRFDKDDWIRSVHMREEEISVVTNFGRIFFLDFEKMNFLRNEIKINDVKGGISASAVTCEAVYLGTVDGSVIIVNKLRSIADCIINQILPLRVVSMFVSGESIIAANHIGDLVRIFPSRFSTNPIKIGKTKMVGKLLCHVIAEAIDIFGDEKGYVHSQEWSVRVSLTEKVCSLQIETGKILANLSNGKSVLLSLQGEILPFQISMSESHYSSLRYLLRSMGGEDSSVSVGFTATDFLVEDSQGVQFRHRCGGHRRPFDFSIKESSSCALYKFVHATNDQVFRIVGKPMCRTLFQGCNGYLNHQVVPLTSSRCFITVNEDNRIRLIDPSCKSENGGKGRVIGAHEGSIRAAFLAGKLLLCGGARSQLSLWCIDDTFTLLKLWTLEDSQDDLRIMAIAGALIGEDSIFIAADSSAGIHRIVASTHQVYSTKKCTGIDEIEKSVCLSAAAFERTNSFFVGAGNGVIVHLDSMGQKLGWIRPHQSGVNAIEIVNGLFVVSVGDDQAIAVSKVDSDGRCLSVLFHTSHGSWCSIRAIASCGNRIFTTGTDRRISEWTITDSGEIFFISKKATAVTDPLSLCVLATGDLVVAGRGIQTYTDSISI